MVWLAAIKNALDILEKLVGWGQRLLALRKPANDSVTHRFFRLFEAHEVHRNQIPRFFGHNLTLQDVQTDADLLPKLDEAILQAVCDLFAVRREWLDGAEAEMYACHDFYKHPENVAPFLQTLKEAASAGNVDGFLLASQEPGGEALIVLKETIGAIGEKPIYRYHLLNNWLFGYWKSRAYLTACIAIAWRHGVYIHAYYADDKFVRALATGTRLFNENDDAMLYRRGGRWDPEDMAIRPEAFLKGIDPERENFGISAAVALWLDLEAQGFMDTGLGMYHRETVRKQMEEICSARTC